MKGGFTKRIGLGSKISNSGKKQKVKERVKSPS